MTTNNHPAHGPVSLDRLHQIREILSKAAAQSDGGNIGYAMADAVKVIDEVLEARNSEPVGAPDAWLWVKSTGYITAGINRPMYEPQHSAAIPLYAAPPATVVPEPATVETTYPDVQTNWQDAKMYAEGWNACRATMLQADNHPEQHLDMVDHFVDANKKDKDVTIINEGNIPATQIKPVADLYGITSPTGTETTFTFDSSEASSFVGSGWSVQEYVELERYQQSVTGKSLVTRESSTCKYCGGTGYFRWQQSENMCPCPCVGCYVPAAPQQEVKSALEHGMRRYAGAMQKLSEWDD
ncbi:hypothetical protein AAGQ40_004749 [Citrobacter freundii]